MDIIYEIRRRYALQKQSISAIAREMGLFRQTVRKYLNTVEENLNTNGFSLFSQKLGKLEGKLTQWPGEEAQLV